jgi:hypothetical protein
MAKLPPRIKVFRTQIGLNDYVVATSSQQAALKAWDVSRNLFASGEAEVTNDPKAIAAALSDIGKAVAMPRPPAKRRSEAKQESAPKKRTAKRK